MSELVNFDDWSRKTISKILEQCPTAEINYYDKIDYKQKYGKAVSLLKRINFDDVKFMDFEDFEILKKEIQDVIDEKE